MNSQTTVGAHTKQSLIFGSGEMAELTRIFDWSGTVVGSPATWPQNLLSTVNLLLASRSPMFLWWGEDLIQFYNDAYRPSLGANGKHPTALGQKAKDCWPEIWDIIYPLIEQVISTAEATWSEDQLIPIYRNGKIEDVYWTFGYSAVRNNTGETDGVLVICMETTEKVKYVQQLAESKGELSFAIDATELGTWDLNPDTNKFSANARLKDWFGLKPNEEIELSLAIEVMAENDRERVAVAIQNSLQYESGGYYDIEYTIIHPHTGIQRHVHAKGRAWFNENKKAYRFNGTLQDITKQVEDRIKVQEAEQRMRALAENSPFPIAVYTGKEMRITLANQPIIDIWGKGSDVIGKTFSEILPELGSQDLFKQLEDVYTTGVPFHAKNQHLDLVVDDKIRPYYFNYSLTPLYDSRGKIYGVMNTGADLTDLNLAKQKIEQNERNFRNMILQSPVAMCILDGPGHVVTVANEVILEIWGKTAEQVANKPLFEGLPEVAGQGLEQLLKQVYTTGERFAASERPIALPRDGEIKIIYVNFVYEALKESDHSISGVMVVASDVTDQVLARQKIEEAEEKARLAITSASLGTYELDLETDVVATSERFKQIWGVEDTTNRQGTITMIHPEDISIRDEARATAKEQGGLDYEVRVIWHDQSIRWVKVSGTVLYDKQENAKTLLGVVQDITEQKLFEKRLAEEVKESTADLQQKNEELRFSEERYHRMIDEVEDYAIILLDKRGIIQNWNKGAEKIKGYKEDEVVGKSFELFYLPEDKEHKLPQRLINEAAKKGKATHEGWRLRKGNDRFWGSIVITALHDDRDNVIGFSKVTRDLTERKLAEDQLKEYSRELEFQNKELEQFAFVASHDMKEPLRKIIFNSNYLSERIYDRLDDKEKESLRRVTVAAKRMQVLIDDILSYSQVGYTDEGKETVDLNTILKDVVDTLKETIEEAGAVISELPSLPAISGVAHQLTQLFDNLLSNAIKYRDQERKLVISITCERGQDLQLNNDSIKGSYYKICISDNGIGFEPAYAEKIFELFQRLHGRKESAGSGIGLSICRKIVQNHNGIIHAEGREGLGASFDIYFPVEQN